MTILKMFAPMIFPTAMSFHLCEPPLLRLPVPAGWFRYNCRQTHRQLADGKVIRQHRALSTTIRVATGMMISAMPSHKTRRAIRRHEAALQAALWSGVSPLTFSLTCKFNNEQQP